VLVPVAPPGSPQLELLYAALQGLPEGLFGEAPGPRYRGEESVTVSPGKAGGSVIAHVEFQQVTLRITIVHAAEQGTQAPVCIGAADLPAGGFALAQGQQVIVVEFPAPGIDAFRIIVDGGISGE